MYVLQLPEEEIVEMMQQMDVTGTGEVAYHEFVVGALEEQQMLTDEKLKAAFAYLDRNHDGFISLGMKACVSPETH